VLAAEAIGKSLDSIIPDRLPVIGTALLGLCARA
jgi:hypothetical protein